MVSTTIQDFVMVNGVGTQLKRHKISVNSYHQIVQNEPKIQL